MHKHTAQRTSWPEPLRRKCSMTLSPALGFWKQAISNLGIILWNNSHSHNSMSYPRGNGRAEFQQNPPCHATLPESQKSRWKDHVNKTVPAYNTDKEWGSGVLTLLLVICLPPKNPFGPNVFLGSALHTYQPPRICKKWKILSTWLPRIRSGMITETIQLSSSLAIEV